MTDRTELRPETLSELRQDAESWLLIGGERVLPLLNAYDALRAEVERLTAQIEAAKRIGRATNRWRPSADVLDEVLRALDGVA